MRGRKLAVYSPCVEELKYGFNSRPRLLLPEAVTVLPEGEARLVVARFGEFGVCLYQNSDGGDIKQMAHTVWEAANRRWAEQVLLEWHRESKEQVEAGIEVPEPHDVQTARAFLKRGRQEAPPETLAGKVAKKLKKGAGAAAILLLLAASAASQELRTANAAYLYDVDVETTRTYCKLTGQNGDPFAAPIPVNGRIETSGSSTTVTEVASGEGPFLEVAAGDILVVDKGTGGIDKVAVTAKASSASITVHTAVDWSAGYSFRFHRLSCGTDADSGWIPVGGYDYVDLAVAFDGGDIGGLDLAFECRYGGLGTPTVQVYPGASSACGFGSLNTDICTLSTASTIPDGQLAYRIVGNTFQECRIALAWRTSDADDTGSNREAVTATIAVSRALR